MFAEQDFLLHCVNFIIDNFANESETCTLPTQSPFPHVCGHELSCEFLPLQKVVTVTFLLWRLVFQGKHTVKPNTLFHVETTICYYITWEKVVKNLALLCQMFITDSSPPPQASDMKVIYPWGAMPIRNFTVLWMLIVWPSLSTG